MGTLARNAVLVAVNALLFCCDPSPDHATEQKTDANIGRLEAVEALERGVQEAGENAADLNQLLEGARQQFEKATMKYEASQKLTATSQATSQKAVDEFAKAEQKWRYYQVLVELAAAVDAANLEKFRAATKSQGVKSLRCEDGMSTSAFRRQLATEGVDIQGKDIDHIVPRSLGGADHPANYQLLSSSLNRSLGNQWGSEKCLAAGAQCAGAVAISRKCGSYAGSGI